MAAALTTLNQLSIRAWTRRDRSAVEHWPKPTLPAHWLDSGACAGRRVSYAVALDSTLIGRITLRDVTVAEARIGIYLRADKLGLGLGWSSLDLFIRLIAFGELALERVVLDTAQDNARAISAFTKAGFHQIGSFERNGFVYLEMERTCTQ